MTGLQERLIKLRACVEAINWVGDRDLATAWAECQHGDWMLWLADTLKVDHKLRVRCVLNCARMVEDNAKDYPAIKACNDVVERWLDGNATLDELRSAAESAESAWSAESAASAARSAAWSAASAAWSAAESAARSAWSAAASAAWSASAAAWSAWSAASAAWSAARSAASAKQADMIRGVITIDVIQSAMEAVK